MKQINRYFDAQGNRLVHVGSWSHNVFTRYFHEGPRQTGALRDPSKVNEYFMVGFPALADGSVDPNARAVPAVRGVVYAAKPSRHVCDWRCLNAKGLDCQCDCGGANHGRGSPKS